VEYFPKHLFSYNKGYNAQAGDLNEDRLVDLSKREVRRDFLRELGIES
jgi:hypothetical protein